MGRHTSLWDFTELPDGRVVEDLRWAGGPGRGDPRGRWLAVWLARAAAASGGAFAAVFLAILWLLYPYFWQNPLSILTVCALLAYLAAWAASRTGAKAVFENLGAAWLYLPVDGAPREALEERLSALFGAAGFTKVGHNRHEFDSVWLGDGILTLRLYCAGSPGLLADPRGASRPNALYLETRSESLGTKAEKELAIHRRLKGQLLFATIENFAAEAEPFVPLKVAREPLPTAPNG